MSDSSLVRRYTESLFAVSEKQGLTDSVREDLAQIGALCADGRLQKVLGAPSALVSGEQKKELLRKLLEGRIQGITLNFLFLLTDRNRTGILDACAEDFEALYYESRNIETAVVESVCELSEEEKQALKQGLEKHLNKTIVISKVVINPGLLGGLRVTVSSDVLDGSAAAALANIKRSLLSL